MSRNNGVIFAFITSDADLFASDAALGLAGFDYADFTLRGLERADRIGFSPGGNNSLVDINWRASSPGDWTRLITAFSPTANNPVLPIPEPTSVLLLGLGLAGIGFSLRGRSA